MKNLILAPWHLMRIVRIVFGIYALFQFYQTQEMMFAVVGLILVLMSVLNFGCGAQGCQIKQNSKTKEDEGDFEEINSK